jgi:hypothetical protein
MPFTRKRLRLAHGSGGGAGKIVHRLKFSASVSARILKTSIK